MLAIASLTSGVLTACSSNDNQNQAANTTATDISGQQNIDHSGMNHSMAMDLGTADASYELRFIDAMIMHHQGAVEMASAAQQKSQRSEIKQLADDIIKSQNQEIAQMKQWRQAWYPQARQLMAYNTSQGQMMEMSSEQMQSMKMSKYLGTADAQFDLRFINAMIPHHQGAVTMAEDALSKSKRPEIKQLAQEIVKAQEVEIEQMQQWRQAWYKN
ncbi:MAG: DUF305 domain-containing protein [Gloeocapsa sp. UFS-A4-WI-NPMV-4B04]|nr:DUF305 domain-containing protein [Gloeocapsa sp. UFS-A4-WI-NPMV-4B04]